MAEIQVYRGNKRAGVKKSKKLSTKVDLTPMVDLGFLLITFLIFTTSMTKPSVMKLDVPKNSKEPTNVKVSGALTIIVAHDMTYYYFGKYTGQLQKCSYAEIRNVIIRKKKVTNAADMFVIIKPAKDALFGNIVNILDEMTINDIGKFSLTDEPTAEEYKLIG